MQRGRVRVAIVGVGNCVSSLVQGAELCRDVDVTAAVPGLNCIPVFIASRPRWRARPQHPAKPRPRSTRCRGRRQP